LKVGGVGLGEQHRFAWCRVGRSANATVATDRTWREAAGATVSTNAACPAVSTDAACATVSTDAACATEA
jgi:hypothetical protein